MSHNEIIIIVSLVLAFGAIYAFGWICWNQGYYAGRNDGHKEGVEVGRLEILNENLIRASILSNLKDDACIKLFDACVSKS